MKKPKFSEKPKFSKKLNDITKVINTALVLLCFQGCGKAPFQYNNPGYLQQTTNNGGNNLPYAPKDLLEKDHSQIAEWIKDQLGQGYSVEEIKKQLELTGMPKGLIDPFANPVISEYYAETTNTQQNAITVSSNIIKNLNIISAYKPDYIEQDQKLIKQKEEIQKWIYSMLKKGHTHTEVKDTLKNNGVYINEDVINEYVDEEVNRLFEHIHMIVKGLSRNNLNQNTILNILNQQGYPKDLSQKIVKLVSSK